MIATPTKAPPEKLPEFSGFLGPSFQDESGVDLNEVETEGLCAFTEAVEDTLSLALIVGCGGLIAVG